MRFDEVAQLLSGVPHTSRERGRQLYDFVLTERPRNVLELGFAHGVSTCYMAAALQELGEGHIVTLDSVRARQRNPSLPELLDAASLGSKVTPVYCERSYIWELRTLLREEYRFDFAFIDGAHTWDVDGFAFLLVDKILRPGSWVLFDDLDWTIEGSPSLRNNLDMLNLPEEERQTPQIREVFDLLVRRDPNYGDLRIDGNWAWARKERLLTEAVHARLLEDTATAIQADAKDAVRDGVSGALDAVAAEIRRLGEVAQLRDELAATMKTLDDILDSQTWRAGAAVMKWPPLLRRLLGSGGGRRDAVEF